MSMITITEIIKTIDVFYREKTTKFRELKIVYNKRISLTFTFDCVLLDFIGKFGIGLFRNLFVNRAIYAKSPDSQNYVIMNGIKQ